MKLYIWKEDSGGYGGASGLVIAAESESEARAIAKAEDEKQHAMMDARGDVWLKYHAWARGECAAHPGYPGPVITRERWERETEDGKLYASLPYGETMYITDDPPEVVDLAPGIILNVGYYE